jgi:hypothetical protein
MRSPQKEAFGVMEVRLGAYTQELVHECSLPCVVVPYVIGEAGVDLSEGKE